jgi:2-amino-4-hydroxy-6-hydroxymethyldihydropteridine diphosphokinase
MKTTTKPHTAYLLLGSNMGDRLAHLKTAIEKIGQSIGTIHQKSRLYETQAWGITHQADFLNQAIAVETNLTPHQVLDKILAIENAMGRVRGEKWTERSIDIDILLYADFVVNEPHLTIPHPELPKRNFALVPLMEIAGEEVHPILGETIEDIYFACTDPLDVFEFEA